MRILLVATHMAPPPGGMESWLLDLIKGLSERHEVALVGPADKDWSLPSCPGFRQFPCPNMFRLLRTDVQQVIEFVVAAARSFQGDVVHLGQTGLGFLIPTLRAQGWPVIVTVHCNDLTKPRISIFEQPALHGPEISAWLSQASLVTAVSRFSRDRALEAGARAPVAVIPCSVDADVFVPANRLAARRKLGLHPDRPLLLSLGRLVPRKGFRDVVACLPALRELDVACVIAGTGPEEPHIRKLIRTLGVEEHCKLLGEVDSADKLLLYQAADVFAMPAFERSDRLWLDAEGFGIVYLEAAACGLPTVAAQAGGAVDAVAHEETGLLILPRDISALTAALRELLGNPFRASALGQAGRRRVLNGFTTRHMISRLEHVYMEAARRHGSVAAAA